MSATFAWWVCFGEPEVVDYSVENYGTELGYDLWEIIEYKDKF